jgi:hypothetical protein
VLALIESTLHNASGFFEIVKIKENDARGCQRMPEDEEGDAHGEVYLFPSTGMAVRTASAASLGLQNEVMVLVWV